MRNKLLLTLGTAMVAALSWTSPAHSSATKAVAVLQGQSNAEFLNADENGGGLGGGWFSIFGPMVKSLTGIPTVDVKALRSEWATAGTGYTIASGTPTYDSTVSGGDSGLWLWANSTTASAWPYGGHGNNFDLYLRVNILNQEPAGVPVALFRFHSEYDTTKQGTDASYYAAANHNFVGKARASAGLSATQMPVFYASPAFWENEKLEGTTDVRAGWLAEINNAANNAHWGLGADSDSNDRGDGSHMDPAGDHQCAARMAIAYARWLYDNGYSVNDLSSLPKLGPRMSRFDRVSGVSNQIDITIIPDKGTDIVIPSTVALGGFDINDNGTSLTATAAARVNATTLRLTISGNLSTSANIKLDYLLWNGYYGPGNLITDNYNSLSKPSYVTTAISTYYPTLTMPLRRLEQPLTIGVTDTGSLDDGGGGITVPSIPSGLTATAGNTQITLSWSASSGANTYNVKRSTTSGSGYSTIASPTTTSYVNTGLTNGTTYYYVVSAVNAAGESGNSSQASAAPSAPAPQAQIAAGTATIDGNVDAAWSNATSYSLTKTTGTITNSADCSATWQGMWDATNLYILVNVTDNVLLKYVTNPWEGDSVEVYIDSTNSKTTTYGATDFQYEFPWNSTVITETKHSPSSLTGVAFAQVNITGGYRIEAKIPWTTLGVTAAANNLIGVDVHVNDADTTAGTRDGKVIWNDGTDQAWGNPSLFGTGKLNPVATFPTTPTGLTATGGSTQVALNWTASTGANFYNVRRSTTSGTNFLTIGSSTTPNYTDTGLTNGTTYYYCVSAVNTVGETANSTQASATPQVAVSPVPTGLSSAAGDTQIVLNWTASTGATTYNIKRATVTGGPYTTVASPAATTYTDTGLTNGTTYYHVVSAVNAGGASANSSQSSATPNAAASIIQATTAPIIDGNNTDAVWGTATSYNINNISGTVSSTTDLSGSFKAAWDATNLYVLVDVTDDVLMKYVTNPWDGDSVELYIDADNNKSTSYDANDFQYEFPWNSTTIVETKHSPASLTGVTFAQVNKTGGYRIEAKIPWTTLGVTAAANNLVGIDVHINDADTTAGTRDGMRMWFDTSDLAWSNPALFGTGKLTAATVTVPAAPTGLTATTGNTQAILNWTASAGATSYSVYRGTTAGGESTTAIATGISGTTYTNTGLTNGTAYFYKVTATNSAGTSGYSNEASATPISPNVHAGTWGLKGIMTTTITFKNTYQSPTGVAASSTYTASFWMRGTGGVTLIMYNGNWASEITRQNFTATSTWTKYSYTIATGANTQLTYVLSDIAGIAGTIYIDDCFLGVLNGTNILGNPGFESGNTVWAVDPSSPWSIVQNP